MHWKVTDCIIEQVKKKKKGADFNVNIALYFNFWCHNKISWNAYPSSNNLSSGAFLQQV